MAVVQKEERLLLYISRMAARLNSFPIGNPLMQNEQLIHTSNRHAFYPPPVKLLPKYVHRRAVAVNRSGT